MLDATDGQRLERWGGYVLLRPDPQVIWKTKRMHPRWEKPDAVYHRSSRGGGEWEIFNLPAEWEISYKALKFRVKPFSFKHTGLFPEQASNWDWLGKVIGERLREAPDKPLRVLNLFAYTGGATLAAAKAGAQVAHLDASKGMVTWARENAEISGLAEKPVRWLVDDCMKFVERELRRGNKYEGIIMDPPSYGRGPKGEIWKMEEQIFGLLEKAADLLSERALFFLLNAYSTGLQPGALSYLLASALPKTSGRSILAAELGLPVSSSGLILPCGISGRVLF